MPTFRDVLDMLTDTIVDVFGLPDPPVHDALAAGDDADECASSPDGLHGAYVGRVLTAVDGVALVVRCGYCAAGRVGDFAIDTTAALYGTGSTETRIRNRTGRPVWLVLNGQRFDFAPDPDVEPVHRARLATDGHTLERTVGLEPDRLADVFDERARGRFVDL